MRAVKKRIVFFVFAVLTICFYMLAVHQMHLWEESLKDVTFVASGEGGFSVHESENIRIGVLWREDAGLLIENQEFGRTAQANVIAMHGRSDYLLKGVPVLDEKSGESCIISTALAYELFGNTDTEGFHLQYNNHTYQVAGVTEQKENFFYYEPGKESEITYERFTQKNSSGKAIDVLEREMQMKWGNGKVVDYTIVRLVLDLYLLVIPVLLGVMAVCVIVTYRKESQTKFEKVIWTVILSLMAVVLGIGIICNFHFPADMIPDKWSDFDFWVEKFEEKKNAMTFLLKTAKTTFDMEGFQAIKRMILYQSGAIVMLLFSLRIWKKDIQSKFLLGKI